MDRRGKVFVFVTDKARWYPLRLWNNRNETDGFYRKVCIIGDNRGVWRHARESLQISKRGWKNNNVISSNIQLEFRIADRLEKNSNCSL